MTTTLEPNWLNYDAAISRVNDYDDKQKEQFVMRGLTVVVNMMSLGDKPDSGLDMLYLARTLEKLYEQKGALASILAGRDESWCDDG